MTNKFFFLTKKKKRTLLNSLCSTKLKYLNLARHFPCVSNRVTRYLISSHIVTKTSTLKNNALVFMSGSYVENINKYWKQGKIPLQKNTSKGV